MTATAQTGQFTVHSSTSTHRHGLPMVLLGLFAPMLVLLVIDPRAVANVSVVAHIYLWALFLIATAAFLISVFETADVTSVTFDKPSRSIILERTGSLARSETSLRFADVATVRIETRYDDDGYQTSIPVLVLATRETIPLPAGTTEQDVVAMRAMLQPS
jgi:hypothetical protein